MPSAAWHRRQAIWRHNGLLGSVALSKSMCVAIYNVKTTTDESKEIAVAVENLLDLLYASLKTRREAP